MLATVRLARPKRCSALCSVGAANPCWPSDLLAPRGVVHKLTLPRCPNLNLCTTAPGACKYVFEFLPHAYFINRNCNKIVRHHDFISYIHVKLCPIGLPIWFLRSSQSQVVRNPEFDESDRSQASDHCSDPTTVFRPTRYSIFTTRSVLDQDRSGREYHQTEG